MNRNSEIRQRAHRLRYCSQFHKGHVFLTLTALIYILACANSARADDGAFYLNKWGSQGDFDGPNGIAMASNGNIYVVDRGNHRIKVFKPSGELFDSWGSSGDDDGQFMNPRGIAIDSSDNVYVADEGNHRIQKFDSSGTFVQKWGSYGSANGQFKYPFGVAVRGGEVYVADTNNHRVQKFQPTTNFGVFIKAVWGTQGNEDGEFSYPRGIAVDSAGNVYVSDSGNHRIQKFDILHAYVDQWGTSGSGNSQFIYPRGVAVDGNGVVYVADYGNHRLQKFNSVGIYIGQWGGYGTEDGKFRYATFVAVHNTCTIVVSDTFNHRVQQFACDNTNFQDQWGGSGTGEGTFNSPKGVAVDGAGNVYVADTDNHLIQKFTSTGSFITQWGGFGTADRRFNHPTSVAVDRENNVYVADRDNNRIQKFTANGSFLTKWTSTSPGGEQLNRPMVVAVDLFPSVYVVDENKVWKFTKGGGFINWLGPDDGSNLGYLYPRSVVADTEDTGFKVIYVSTFDSVAHFAGIRKFRASAPYQDYYYLGEQQGEFDALAIDGDHIFYSVNSSTHRIQKFTSSFSGPSSFGFFHEWGGFGNGTRRFNRPSGIAVDKDFNIYVADTENHRIQKFRVQPCITCFFN